MKHLEGRGVSTTGDLKRAVFLGVVSVVILASEVALTRLFNVFLWYHFGFLILFTTPWAV